MSCTETHIGKLKCTGKTEAEFTGSPTKDIFDFVEENELFYTGTFLQKFIKLPDGLIWEIVSDTRLKEHTIRFFNVINIDLSKRYNFWDIRSFLNALTSEVDGPELEAVPIIYDEFSLPETRSELITIAEGKSVLADTQREGLVFRAVYNPKLSFKVISNKYLLKHGK